MERSGPCSCPDPNLLLPQVPSPAHHLIRPDNGTSRGGACAVLPGPIAQEEGSKLENPREGIRATTWAGAKRSGLTSAGCRGLRRTEGPSSWLQPRVF